MEHPLLDVRDHLTGIGFIPAPVQVLGHEPKLNDEIARQIFRLGLAALLPPQPHQGPLILPHDDPGV